MPSSNDNKARKVAEEALSKLSAELEAGKSEALQNCLAAMSHFRHYSWNNAFLIAAQRPNATHVAGIHTWNDLGRTVKKGEKGIMIFAPMVLKREASPDRSPEKPKELGAKELSRLAGFRTAYVFDVSQTEGKPLPEFAKTTGAPKDYTDKIKAIAAQRGISVEYDGSIAPALGMSSGGRIRLVPDLAKGEEFAVLVHELAHEMLHHGKGGERQPKVVRETQAEAVAFVVCRGIGLETNNAAADYIALYNGDKKTLMESLSVIQETSAKILDDLLPKIALFGRRRAKSRTHPSQNLRHILHGKIRSPWIADGWPDCSHFADFFMGQNSEILNVNEVAALLRCSKAHVCKAIQGRVRGVSRLPALSMGRRKLIRKQSLDAWLAQNDRSAFSGTMDRSHNGEP